MSLENGPRAVLGILPVLRNHSLMFLIIIFYACIQQLMLVLMF